MKRLAFIILLLVPTLAHGAVSQFNALSWCKADGTDQTTRMQTAVNAAVTAGQPLYVPPGIVFTWASLTNTTDLLMEDYSTNGMKRIRGTFAMDSGFANAVNVEELYIDGLRVYSDTVNVLSYGAVADNATDNAAAFNAASAAGSTIFVPDGTYKFSEAWVITNSNRRIVMSENAKLVCTNATYWGSVVVFVGTAGNIITNCWFTGGHIENTSTANEDAIGFTYVSNGGVEGVTVDTVPWKALTTQEGCSDIWFRKNMIVDSVYGISIESFCTNVFVIENSIRYASKNGIDITTGSDPCENVQVRNNFITEAGLNGINAYDVEQLVIEGNQIGTAGQHGIYCSTTPGVGIRGNTIVSAVRNGVNLFNITTSPAAITDNTIFAASVGDANTYDAFYANICHDLEYKGNRVRGADHRYSIYTGDAAGHLPVCEGNTLVSGVTGIYGGWAPLMARDMVGGYEQFSGIFTSADTNLTIAPARGATTGNLSLPSRTIIGGTATSALTTLDVRGGLQAGGITAKSGGYAHAFRTTDGDGILGTAGTDAAFDTDTRWFLGASGGAGLLTLYDGTTSMITARGSDGLIKGSSYDMNSGKFGVDVDGHMHISGNFTAYTVTATNGYYAGAIPGLTTIYTNMISGVITQRLSFVGGILLTNETLP